ncbi:MAG: hypothetical protein LBE36_05145 [Flavobacteriaceae bacterium]|jgi:hypothetical protein|nr:hypothetical protein [Flavobacteriaceae bacterium]
MSNIKLKNSDINVFPAKFSFYVNGEKIEFKNYETINFKIPEGKYTFYAEYLWYKSNEISLTINTGETKEFVISRMYHNLSIIFGFLIIIMWIVFYYLFQIKLIWILYFAVFPFIITFYYRTFGWKKFLKLKKL